MGYKKEGLDIFRLKCDECGESSGAKSEQGLRDEGWTWFEIRVSSSDGGQDVVNRAYCCNCEGDKNRSLEALKEMIGYE